MSWILMILALIGVILNIRKDPRGFIVWIVSNAGWVAYDVYIQEYAAAVMFIVFTGTSVWGYIKWSNT